MKRNHIQKCLQWCEKNQIPCNKFIDNTNTNNNNNITNIHNNIFLNMKNRVTQHGNDIQNVDVELEEDIITLVNEMVDFVINDKC